MAQTDLTREQGDAVEINDFQNVESEVEQGPMLVTVATEALTPQPAEAPADVEEPAEAPADVEEPAEAPADVEEQVEEDDDVEDEAQVKVDATTPDLMALASAAVEEAVIAAADAPSSEAPAEQVAKTEACTNVDSEPVVPFPNPAHYVDMSYINTRTSDPSVVRGGDGATPLSAVASSSATVKKAEDGGWNVDVSYIDSRTKDPNCLTARRASAGGAFVEATSATVKKAGEGWSVDMSHIDVRTRDPNRLQARRSIGCAQAAGAPEVSSATVKKVGDGKWSVDTSYIDARTKDPNCLTARKMLASKEERDQDATPLATKEADGKWRQVATPHIGIRTADVGNLTARRRSFGDIEPSSATVSKSQDGGWKVNTSYIGFRTQNPDNIRVVEKANENVFADPSQTKYSYEQLKMPSETRPKDVNPAAREQYLSPEDFKAVFAMEPDEFAKMPRWKQINLKKSKQLY